MPNKYALLVGVDLYLNDDSRQHTNGKPVSLPTLQGAANDVEGIQAILRDRFRFDKPTVLTCSPSPTDPRIPREPEDKWPTYVNINKAFEDILHKVNSGDIFFFHFSGHGASLHTTELSPQDGRSEDPSLMTADYGRGEPAVRGWQLNTWLQDLNSKNVRVIVLLDSCHSGGAWRTGSRFRSPENWTPPPNLPADEEAAQGTQRKPGHRDGDLEECWDINPKGFTLMAACQSRQKAAERDEDGAAYGAFTLALRNYLQDLSNPSTSTYHVIRDRTAHQLASWDLSQDPQVFGRDRLAFLEDYEPFVAAPIVGTVQCTVFLPVGKVHGISKGAEFITTSGAKAIVSISEVDDHESKALVKSGFIQDPWQPIQLIPFRWSAETLEIVVDPNLGHEFRKTLGCDLGKRIAGNIHFPERSQWTGSRDSQDIWFRLGINGNGGIDIFGPEQLVGGQGPVRGWTAKGKTDEDRARESAIALAHLFRFGQILHLRNKSENPARFKATAKQADATDVQKVDYEFQNLDGEELYFAVLILSPGFHVKQLFPNTDTLQEVPPSGRRSLKFRLTVPKELGGKEVQGPQHEYRDIIRTVVTKGSKGLSLRSMELPDIWNADQVDKVRSSAHGRDANLLESDFSWWIQDDKMPTK